MNVAMPHWRGGQVATKAMDSGRPLAVLPLVDPDSDIHPAFQLPRPDRTASSSAAHSPMLLCKQDACAFETHPVTKDANKILAGPQRRCYRGRRSKRRRRFSIRMRPPGLSRIDPYYAWSYWTERLGPLPSSRVPGIGVRARRSDTDDLLVKPDVVIHHPLGRKVCLDVGAAGAPIEVGQAPECICSSVQIGHKETSHSVHHDFGHRTSRIRDHRCTGGHCLDDRQPEWLLEADQVDQSGGATEQGVPLSRAYRADVPYSIAVQEGLNPLTEVGRVVDDARR